MRTHRSLVVDRVAFSSYSRRRDASATSLRGMATRAAPPAAPTALATPAPPRELSNIEAFVASATPVFVVRGDPTASSSQSSSGYALSELFAAFDEPSAFGAEVPLRLHNTQDVSQYYVPFLSGVQLYVRESDDADGGERLAFEFFETSSPYSRPSMSETTRAITDAHPELAHMRSDALAPSSWMSVAWYPIYRIPQGTMLHDVQGSFLTYHALYDGALRDGDVACPLPPAMSDAQERLIEERVTRAKEAAAIESGGGGGVDDDDDATGISTRVLRPFGLSVYKMQGDVWAANERATKWMESLMDGAFTWLRFRKIIHADYEFFAHFG